MFETPDVSFDLRGQKKKRISADEFLAENVGQPRWSSIIICVCVCIGFLEVR